MVANRDNIPYHYYTLEEYFALEHAGDARFEYWDGDIVCMSGGAENHYLLSRNLIVRLQVKLDGGPCQAFPADVPMKTPTLPPYRYPDVSVVCGKPKFEKISGIDALINPVLIIEVMSPSTASRDKDQKFKAYQSIPTFKDYLLVSQDSVDLTHYSLQSDGFWLRKDMTDLSTTLEFESIGASLSVREIYRELPFDSNS